MNKEETKAMRKYYVFTFLDGYRIWAAGMSKLERVVEEEKHGRLVSKEPVPDEE